jgi:hypothetical protein
MTMTSTDETKGAQANAQRTLIFGSVVWVLLVGCTLAGWLHLEFLELLFLIAPWIVVPTGIQLLPQKGNSNLMRWETKGVVLQFAAAFLATVSFLFPSGRIAALLAACWLLVCSGWALDGLLRILKFRAQSFAQICFAAGEIYLAVGGAWLIASRLGMQPAGFVEPIVLLTGVHFHFAGFLCCLFAGFTYRRLGNTPWAKPICIVLLGTVLGPGMLAVGFLIGPKVKLFAAMLVVIGQCGLAAGMTRIAWQGVRGFSRIALQASAICVVTGMIFAALWALGEYPLHPFADLYRMERIHGILNAVGFGVVGLTGWTRIRALRA